MNVSRYLINENLTLFNVLFLKGDKVFIQSYDPVSGRPQKVFLEDKTFLGTITSDTYWKLEKKMEKLADD